MLRRVIGGFFALKARECAHTARWRFNNYLPGTYGWEWGKFGLALGNLFAALAKAVMPHRRER